MKKCSDCKTKIKGGILCPECASKRRTVFNKHPEKFGTQHCDKCGRNHFVNDKCKVSKK